MRKAIENLDRYGTNPKYSGVTLKDCAILFLSTPLQGTTEADYNSFLTAVLETTFSLRGDAVTKELRSFNDSAVDAMRAWSIMKHVPPVECLTESKKTKISVFKHAMVR